MAKINFLRTLLLVIVAAGSAPLAHAQTRDDDEVGSMAIPISPERMKKRAYPGGRDEQELEVQTVLAQPTRSPEAVAKPAGAPVEDEALHD